MYSPKFPVVCIDLEYTAGSGIVALLESGKLRMFKGTSEFYQTVMLGREFCDMNGQVCKLKSVSFRTDTSIVQFFRFAFSLPEIATFEFIPTAHYLELDAFKERCKQLIKLESIEEVWERECMEIDNAQNFHEAIGRFGLGWQSDVVK